MDNNNLKAQVHFQELASSAYLAAKLSLLLMIITALAPTSILALGITCVVLAGVCRLIELRMSIRDPAFYILLACGLLFCAMDLAATPVAENKMHYFAAATIFALLLFYFIYSITRQSFTFLYGKVQGVPVLRRQHCRMWLSVYAVASLIVLLLPWPGSMVLMLILVLLACLGHGYLQLVGVGTVWRSAQRHRVGEFEFRRLNNTMSELKPLYELYLKELMPSLAEGDKFTPTPMDQLVPVKMAAEQDVWDRVVFVGAYHNQQMVGTMSCQFDAPTQKLPFEEGHSQPLSLNKLREVGSIVELGKFCVAENYRMSPEVFSGLLISATELALERDVAFLVLQSVMRSARIYSKMGFTTLTKEPVINLDYGIKVQLLAKNISNESETENRMMGNVQEHFSQYILGRFIWRQIVLALYRTAVNKQVPVSIPTRDLATLAVFS